MLTKRRILEGTVALAAVAAVTTSTVAWGGTSTTTDDLRAFEDRFVSISRDVGMVIEVGTADAHGMKRAIGAVDRGELGGIALRRDADIWLRALERSSAAMRKVTAPAGLEFARRQALRSFEAYQDLARILASIADARPTEHDHLLDRAVAAGGLGDDRFDSAAAVIQANRRRLGLEPLASLPDPERPLPPGVEIYEPDELYPEDF